MPASIQPELSALRSDLVRLELKCASLASIPSRLAKPVLKVPPALQAFYAHDHPPQRSNSVAVATFMDLVDRLRACRDDSLAYFDTLNQVSIASALPNPPPLSSCTPSSSCQPLMRRRTEMLYLWIIHSDLIDLWVSVLPPIQRSSI